MRQDEKEKKKFQSRIPFILDPVKKILKKRAKKFKIVKNLFPTIFLSKTGRDRPRKRKKNFSPEFCSCSTRLKKFRKKQQKKNQNYKKTSFRHYLQLKRDEIGQEREKKILDPDSVHTRPRQENSEKYSEKIKKIKKSLLGNISRQNGMRKAEKE